MEKRGVLLLVIIFIIIISFLSISCFSVKAQYETNMTKAFVWLENKTAAKEWPKRLFMPQYVFSFLALKDRISESSKQIASTNLMDKGFLGKCWPAPEPNCEAKETALAKLMLDAAGRSTENVNIWLLNSTTDYKKVDWYLQLTQKNKELVECALWYDGTWHRVNINITEEVEGDPGPWFTKEEYLLKLKQEYINKEINITCNKNTMINFLFKKNNNWYVTSPNYYEDGAWHVSGTVLEIVATEPKTIKPIPVFCLTSSPETTECDYEASIWTAYAFVEKGQKDEIRGLIPYLVLENNKSFLPASFLFKITNSDRWLSELKTRQNPTNKLWLAFNSAYNEFYDTALVGIMTGGKAGAGDWSKAKRTLFGEQTRRGNWVAPENPDPIRDTALILLALQIAPEELVECIIEGYDCVSSCSALDGILKNFSCPEGFECCDVDYGPNECGTKGGTCKLSCAENEVVINYRCPEFGKKCCILPSLVACAELEGKKCSAGQKCVKNRFVIPFITTKDGDCCLGDCVTPTENCSALGGVICNSSKGFSCDNKWLPAIDTEICCLEGACNKVLKSCSNMGGEICENGQLCKDGTFVVAKDTAGKSSCCVSGGKCIFEICPGDKCGEDEVCDGTQVEALDAPKCCLDGDCLKSCSAVGESCPPPGKCDKPITGTDNRYCCEVNQCVEKGKKGFPFWLLILILIALGIVLFLYMRKKKKKKPKAPAMMMRGMPPGRRPRRGIWPRAKAKKPARLGKPGVPPMPRAPRPPARLPAKPVKPMPAVKPAFPVKPAAKPAVKPAVKPSVKPKVKEKRKAVLEELEKISKE